MRLRIFFLFFFLITSTQSEDFDSTLDLHPLSTLESDPSFSVNGVNVISGEFVEFETDFTVPGCECLNLHRSYSKKYLPSESVKTLYDSTVES